MLLRLNPAFDAMRNKLAANGSGIVAYGLPGPNANRQFSRNYVIPDNPSTALQSAVRSRFTAVSQGWSLLSVAAASAWDAAAALVTLQDALGRSYNPSGKALYQQVNTYRLADGQALSSSVPSLVANSNYQADAAAFNKTTNILTITVVADVGDNLGHIAIRITPPWPILTNANLQARPTDLRYFNVDSAACIVPTENDHSVTVSPTGAQLNAAVPSWLEPQLADDDTIFVFGVDVVNLNADYFPSSRVFTRQQQFAVTS